MIMKYRFIFLLLLIFTMNVGEAIQGRWQGDTTYDAIVWQGYKLSGIQLRMAENTNFVIIDSETERVVAKGWTCFFETGPEGDRKIKPLELKDLKLQHMCGIENDFNVWLDFLFFGYKKERRPLLLGALPLSLYPSNILPAVDEIQSWIKNKDEQYQYGSEGNVDVATFLPWPICGDDKTSSPEVILDTDRLTSAVLKSKCEYMIVDEINNVGCGDTHHPTAIELLNSDELLNLDSAGALSDYYYRIKNVREWAKPSIITIGNVGFKKADGDYLSGSVNITKCKIAICDKHKELRRLYIEFEFTNPNLFETRCPKIKVEKMDESKPNSLTFFVGIQVQPRNASEICIDDEWLEDEEEDLSL